MSRMQQPRGPVGPPASAAWPAGWPAEVGPPPGAETLEPMSACSGGRHQIQQELAEGLADFRCNLLRDIQEKTRQARVSPRRAQDGYSEGSISPGAPSSWRSSPGRSLTETIPPLKMGVDNASTNQLRQSRDAREAARPPAERNRATRQDIQDLQGNWEGIRKALQGHQATLRGHHDVLAAMQGKHEEFLERQEALVNQLTDRSSLSTSCAERSERGTSRSDRHGVRVHFATPDPLDDAGAAQELLDRQLGAVRRVLAEENASVMRPLLEENERLRVQLASMKTSFVSEAGSVRRANSFLEHAPDDSKERPTNDGEHVAKTTDGNGTHLRNEGEEEEKEHEEDEAEDVEGEEQAGGKASNSAHRKKIFSTFPDAELMRDELKSSIMRQTNADPYHDTGVAACIARSTTFDYSTLFVIALNSFWLAVDADNNEAETLDQAEVMFQVMDHAFCLFFSFEWIVRFFAFKDKRDCLRDTWFVFDSFLVFSMVFETWVITVFVLAMGGGGGEDAPLGDLSILKIVRLMRLTRMARLVRLARAVPELMITVKALAVATRSVTCALALLMIIIYGFAVAMVQVTKEDKIFQVEYFSTVWDTVGFLFLVGVMPDQASLLEAAGARNWMYVILLLACMMLITLTGVNLIAGTLVEVVRAVSTVEKERMDLTHVKTILQNVWDEEHVDRGDDRDQIMSKGEFFTFLRKATVQRALGDIGVDVIGLVEMAEYMFKGDRKLNFPDFMDELLELRGSNNVTVKDIVNLRKVILNDLPKTMRLVLKEHTGCATVNEAQANAMLGSYQKIG